MTIKHDECPACGSKDNLAVYPDGGQHCFTPDCSYHVRPSATEVSFKVKKHRNLKMLEHTGMIAAIPNRYINENTCKKYNVTQIKGKHYYPYYDESSTIIARKVRDVSSKSFHSEGQITQARMFGQQLFTNGGKYVTLCEGEIDTLSAYQMLGSKWPVVSIKNGAKSAVKDVKEQYEWLMTFENIHICFDQDESGIEAAKKVAEILSPKAKIIKLQHHKDANEYLINKKEKLFVEDWWSAESFTPEGIIAGENMWDLIQEDKSESLINYPFTGLQKLTYGIRSGELITVTAGSGLGKSQFMRELLYHIVRNSTENIGLMFMEESIRRTGLSLMSLDANKPLHLPDVYKETSTDEFKKAFNNTLGSGRLFLYDHFGSNQIETILSRVRYFARALNCKYICLDHVSIIVSDQSLSDERRALDEIMTKLRTLVQELDIVLFLVSHLRRPSGSGHEEGAVTSLSQLRGSAAIGQLSDIVIGLERNGQHEDERERHITTVRVIKNRFSGLTGPACKLFYDLETGRMQETFDEVE
jgi:twinkle protein